MQQIDSDSKRRTGIQIFSEDYNGTMYPSIRQVFMSTVY